MDYNVPNIEELRKKLDGPGCSNYYEIEELPLEVLEKLKADLLEIEIKFNNEEALFSKNENKIIFKAVNEYSDKFEAILNMTASKNNGETNDSIIEKFVSELKKKKIAESDFKFYLKYYSKTREIKEYLVEEKTTKEEIPTIELVFDSIYIDRGGTYPTAFTDFCFYKYKNKFYCSVMDFSSEPFYFYKDFAFIDKSKSAIFVEKLLENKYKDTETQTIKKEKKQNTYDDMVKFSFDNFYQLKYEWQKSYSVPEKIQEFIEKTGVEITEELYKKALNFNPEIQGDEVFIDKKELYKLAVPFNPIDYLDFEIED